MINLADATNLLDETTRKLTEEPQTLTPPEGITIIDQWITPLENAENTKPIAEQLKKLKTMLHAENVDSNAVTQQLEEIAGELSLLAPETGSEGEMPSLIEGLAAALRLAAGGTKTE